MSAIAKSSRLVMLGIDAAEHTVIDALIARGRMPNLARLRRAGRYGLLRSPSDLYSGAVWPTFYSGRRVPWHGIYHNKLWQPARMCCTVPDEQTYHTRPFWESLAPAMRTCIVDVPLVLGQARAAKGVYLNGWATHDSAALQSSPSNLHRELERAFGPRVLPRDNFGRQDLQSLEQLLGELLRATEQLQRIALALLRRETWDFACIVFGAAHRAGHYLWDLTQARDASAATEEQRARLAAAVERVYEAVDAALEELLAYIGTDIPVIVFSLHGMGPNDGWNEIVPEILDAWRASRSQQVVRRGALYNARKALVGAARPLLRHIRPGLPPNWCPCGPHACTTGSRHGSFRCPWISRGYCASICAGVSATASCTRAATTSPSAHSWRSFSAHCGMRLRAGRSCQASCARMRSPRRPPVPRWATGSHRSLASSAHERRAGLDLEPAAGLPMPGAALAALGPHGQSFTGWLVHRRGPGRCRWHRLESARCARSGADGTSFTRARARRRPTRPPYPSGQHMIIDARRDTPRRPLECDLCVIGAGAAGLTLATQLESPRRLICVLESGGRVISHTTQALLAGESDANYPPLQTTRAAALGGSTQVWSGWCRPLDANDFEHRVKIPHSGWPIKSAELQPYYVQAHEILQLGPYDYDPATWERVSGSTRWPLLEEQIATLLFRQSPVRFGSAFAPELRKSAGIRIYLHANVLRLEYSAQGNAVAAVEAVTLNGQKFEVRPRLTVLAAGGIENARLLLLSNRPGRELGHVRSPIGRYFTEHGFVDGADFRPSSFQSDAATLPAAARPGAAGAPDRRRTGHAARRTRCASRRRGAAT